MEYRRSRNNSMDKERDGDQGAKSSSVVECEVQFVYMAEDDNKNVLLWVNVIAWRGRGGDEGAGAVVQENRGR